MIAICEQAIFFVVCLKGARITREKAIQMIAIVEVF